MEDSDDVIKGVERARQFLKDFIEIPLDKMEFQQAIQRVRELKEDLKKDAATSRWIQQFF